MAVAFYSSFCKCETRGRKIREKNNNKKLSQFLKSHISGTLEAISLKFGMWSAEVEGRVHNKNRLVSSRQHRATEMQKLRFLLPFNILTGVARRLLGPHDTLYLDTSNTSFSVTDVHVTCYVHPTTEQLYIPAWDSASIIYKYRLKSANLRLVHAACRAYIFKLQEIYTVLLC